MDEALQKCMAGLQFAGGFPDGAVQFLEVVGTVIAQRVTFEMIPTVFIGIQFGRVRGQEFDVQARMSSEKFANLFSPMSIQSIPN